VDGVRQRFDAALEPGRRAAGVSERPRREAVDLSAARTRRGAAGGRASGGSRRIRMVARRCAAGVHRRRARRRAARRGCDGCDDCAGGGRRCVRGAPGKRAPRAGREEAHRPAHDHARAVSHRRELHRRSLSADLRVRRADAAGRARCGAAADRAGRRVRRGVVVARRARAVQHAHPRAGEPALVRLSRRGAAVVAGQRRRRTGAAEADRGRPQLLGPARVARRPLGGLPRWRCCRPTAARRWI